jgi:hypothetical protein
LRVVKLTGVQQVRRGISSIECVRLAVRIIRITLCNITRRIGKPARRAVAVVEKLLRVISLCCLVNYIKPAYI